MKLLITIFLAMAILSSCSFDETIEGNGKIKSIQSSIIPTEKLKLKGNFNVLVQQGSEANITLQADENVLPYILVEKDDDGYTIIKTKSGYKISSENVIQINYTASDIEALSLVGSGDIIATDKITNNTKLNINISGSGNVNINVHSPNIESKISGSGNITLVGESQNASISISGDGEYKAEELLAENVKVNISGSGNVRVFADAKLDIKISGSGDVFYKGKCVVTNKISGSGNIKIIE